MCWQHRRVSGAFTLVELLVTIAVIAVLVAMLLPALSAARRQAQAVKCMANLHALGQALVMYTQETRYYPRTQRDQNDPSPAVVWAPCLRLYLQGNRDVFFCPARDLRCVWSDPPMFGAGVADAKLAGNGYKVGETMLNAHLTPFSYGYNGIGPGVGADGHGSALGFTLENKASLVRVTGDMIAIADGEAIGYWDFVLFPSIDSPYGNLGTVHSGGANVLFCDGHVQRHLRKDLQVSGADWSDVVAVQHLKYWQFDHSGQ
jgi:prepilin-type processing-associated H-X9-DG protein/prepilin-type N-terminal cleavage/methylation domain-containing protein